MNITNTGSTDTLKRYLRNFDPLNESLFKVPDTSSFAQEQGYSSEGSVAASNNKSNQASNTKPQASALKQLSLNELQNFQKSNRQPSFSKHSKFNSSSNGAARDSVHYETVLHENKQMKNKLLLLAQHVSALEFQNQQMDAAMKKQHSRKNSVKSSTRKAPSLPRNNNNHNNHHNQDPQDDSCFFGKSAPSTSRCDRCEGLSIEVGMVWRNLQRFLSDYSNLYLVGESPVPIQLCHSFQTLMSNYLPQQPPPSPMFASNQTVQTLKYISEAVLASFEQLDFISNKYTSLEQEHSKELRKYLKEISTLKQSVSAYQRSQIVGGWNESLNQLSALLRMCLKSETAKANVLQYTDLIKQKQQTVNSIAQIQRNLKHFKDEAGTSSQANNSLYRSELDFKQNMLLKQQTKVKRIADKLNSLHTKIVASIDLKTQATETTAAEIPRYMSSMGEYPRTTHSSMASSIHNSRPSTHSNHCTSSNTSLFQQLIGNKQNLGGTAPVNQIRLMELNRQSSLMHLKQKIKQAEQSVKKDSKHRREQGQSNNNVFQSNALKLSATSTNLRSANFRNSYRNLHK